MPTFPPGRVAATVGALQRAAYDRTMTVQAETLTRQPGGQQTRAWGDVAGAADVPCSYRPLSDDEKMRAGMRVTEKAVRIKCDRFTVTADGAERVGVRARDRIVMDDGEVLYVFGNPQDVQGAGRWLHFTARNEP